MTRSASALILAAALSVALSGAAAAQTRARSAPLPPPDPAPTKPALRTSDDVKKGSLEGAATTPLRDLGVMKVDIPQVLLDALEDPYARPPPKAKCSVIIALVRPLNDALGPDIDTVPQEDEGWTKKGKSTALGVAGDLAGGAIPFRGVVRKLSGAESHDRLVNAAIIAGHTRRAYLKGLGEARGCAPPATPTHARTAVKQAKAAEAARVSGAGGPPPPAQTEKGGLKPRYPTR